MKRFIQDHWFEILSAAAIVFTWLTAWRAQRVANRSAAASERSATASEVAAKAAKAVQRVEEARRRDERRPEFKYDIVLLGSQQDIIAVQIDYLSGPTIDVLNVALESVGGSQELFRFNEPGTGDGPISVIRFTPGSKREFRVSPPNRFGGRARLVLVCQAGTESDPEETDTWKLDHVFSLTEGEAQRYRRDIGVDPPRGASFTE